jgi:hypothetical protein
MRAENVLWWFDVACAALLMFVSLSSRTTWIEDHANLERAATIIDSAGWDWTARLAGIAAVAALVIGRWARLRPVATMLCASTATIAFGVSAVVSGQYWLDLTKGAGQVEGYVIHPATGVPYAAVIATLGTGYSLVLAISSWRSAPSS